MRTVYKNGTVYTGNGFVTDFAVENGKFCFVGETDKATADEVVDLDGKFVCAGFNDSHMHHRYGVFKKLPVRLAVFI